jgi:hypothetical protein
LLRVASKRQQQLDAAACGTGKAVRFERKFQEQSGGSAQTPKDSAASQQRSKSPQEAVIIIDDDKDWILPWLQSYFAAAFRPAFVIYFGTSFFAFLFIRGYTKLHGYGLQCLEEYECGCNCTQC